MLSYAAALFAISALMFARIYLQSRSGTLYWHIMHCRFPVWDSQQSSLAGRLEDPISWTGSAAQFPGGVYFLKAVQTAFWLLLKTVYIDPIV